MSNNYHVFEVTLTLKVDAVLPEHAARIAMADIKEDVRADIFTPVLHVRYTTDPELPDEVFKVYTAEDFAVQRVYQGGKL